MPTQFNHSTQLWTQVEERLEAFARAWKLSPEAPDPAKFVPDKPVELRRLILAEVVKFDLECRMQRGLPKLLEDYFAEFPELAEGDGPSCDLLYEDFHLRRQAGQAADPADYFQRFPGRAAELARLLGKFTSTRSTSLFATRAPTGVAPGDQLDDFDLLALLGEGQFAKVFLARQRSMQRLVALKVSACRGAEAQTLAQLDHPHIVRVYDQRVVAARGLLLVYMPYLAGGALLDVLMRAQATPPLERSGRTLLAAVDAALERRGELPPSDSSSRRRWAERSWPSTVCAIGAKLAAALDYAHRRDVLHRDVKPANVLLTAEGEPLLADFNIGCCSKLDGAGPAAFFGGSLAYMSLEHLEAFNPEHPRLPESLDGRSDLFSLAVTLWELLACDRPFRTEHLHGSWTETLATLAAERQAGPTAEATAALDEGNVRGFKAILLRSLAANPADRPATAGELASELELCLKPATRALVRPAPGGWREFVRRRPLSAIYPPTIAANILASLLNISYNKEEIIANWTDRDAAQHAFEVIIPVVNGVLFPFGMLLFALAIRPVSRGLAQLRSGMSLHPGELAHLRQRALRLGQFTAVICAGCWLLAGIVWPIALRVAAGPPEGPGTYVHFLVSLVICGLIAAAYPYFLVTFLTVRVFYPALLGLTGPTSSDGPALRRVERDLGRYRAAAAGVPLLAVALLASRGASSLLPVAAMGLAGLAGVALAYVIEGLVRADLTALAEAPSSNP